MKNSFFEPLVVAVLKHKHKILTMEKIKAIFARVMGSEYSDKKMYKMLYYMKNRWYLITIKKNIYFVTLMDDEYTQEWLIDRFYRELVKKHCKEYVFSRWYIWWIKALELHFSAYDIPDEIMIVNADKQSTEVIMFDKKVLFKTYVSGWKNLFSLYKKYVQKISLWRTTLPVICPEIALLESLYNPSIVHKGYIEWLVKKMLKKYKNTLDPAIWAVVVRNNKHHSSINRLYDLAQWVDKKLAWTILAVIKKYSYILT